MVGRVMAHYDVEVLADGKVVSACNAGPFGNREIILTTLNSDGSLNQQQTVGTGESGAALGLATQGEGDTLNAYVAGQRKVF